MHERADLCARSGVQSGGGVVSGGESGERAAADFTRAPPLRTRVNQQFRRAGMSGRRSTRPPADRYAREEREGDEHAPTTVSGGPSSKPPLPPLPPRPPNPRPPGDPRPPNPRPPPPNPLPAGGLMVLSACRSWVLCESLRRARASREVSWETRGVRARASVCAPHARGGQAHHRRFREEEG